MGIKITRTDQNKQQTKPGVGKTTNNNNTNISKLTNKLKKQRGALKGVLKLLE